MNDLRLPSVFILIASVLTHLVCAQISPTDPDSIIITIRCPNVCLPPVEAFTSCARFILNGCVPVPCGGGNLRCSAPGPATNVPPGGDIVLERVRVLDQFSFQVNLNTTYPLQTDIYLLSDATGSMRTAIAEVRTRFSEIVEMFESVTDAHFGIGFFRDESELGNGFMNLQGITGDRAAVQTAIDSLVARGGGDRPEANLVALHQVATDSSIGWRPASRKILMYFGDNPGHEPTCVGSVPLDRDEVIKALNAMNITVVAVSFNPGLDGNPTVFGCSGAIPAGPGQGTAISTATGGVLVPNTQQTQLIEALENAVLNIDRTFDIDTSDCDGKLTTTTDPMLPVTLAAGDSQVIEQSVIIDSGICDTVGPFECQFNYTEAGAALPPTRFRVLEVDGCP
ncbi:hypothetical protein BWQ96_07303 [Gracilariopsis chorda]|uniref:VWFA domain-containing protein n=1 Tax=Gracilariopsis chorda TaxID=448386 RepID=A0A2V3ILK4_9FLOR|nr:hypothetical protein BWQ96_07303 [Gracilariopsis chorda]|eukprot:PXF42965.1 hypothetical protein BWQ96_07303 [Gracilariopsis chorda]